MNITIQGTNLELTPELRAFVEEKLQDTLPAFGKMNLDPVRFAIELERTSNHHRKDEMLYRAEANVSVPGRLIRVEETSPDLQQAIVKMKETLFREVRTWREKQIDRKRQGAREAKALFNNREEE
ncbi:MAG: hypothetical protein KatS3mg044_0904 [Rhodothermaceae bacterium]|nr:MAG: ribosome-associated translation inhibitor RaiA [Bacteroidota bacterium]GIV62038.1 MAG: hypothetical protein KatS3mg044_0904 [Rhodothermaceae bacterium]